MKLIATNNSTTFRGGDMFETSDRQGQLLINKGFAVLYSENLVNAHKIEVKEINISEKELKEKFETKELKISKKVKTK